MYFITEIYYWHREKGVWGKQFGVLPTWYFVLTFLLRVAKDLGK